MDNSAHPHRAYTLFVLVLVFTSSHVDRQIIGILGQPIKEALEISDAQLGLLGGLMFALFYATLGVPMAMWADRRNRRNLIAFSITLWSGMTAVCGLAQNYWQLLIARIGVGVGEAGSNPPSHSIISDLYAPHERATAMAIFATGVNIGICLGYLIGGWVNEYLGWQAAFFAVGFPGLIIALLVRFTLTEPARGYSERIRTQQPAPPFGAVAKFMIANPLIRQVVIGNTLMAFAGYALVIWVPTFLQRVFDMGSGETGTILAVLVGVGGAVGTFTSGLLADRLSTRNEGWRGWVVAGAILLATPFAAGAFLAADSTTAVWCYVMPAVLLGAYIGPGFAIVQTAMPLEMRSVGAAINLFIANIVGLGAGPTTVGILSDYLAPTVGEDSLRYALLAMVAVLIWGALHFVRVGQLVSRQAAEVTPATV